MLKRVTVLRRRDDVDGDVAVDHWMTTHAELVHRVPGVVRYVQRPCTASADSASDPALLGIGEVWFESRDDAVAATEAPEWSTVVDDARTFAILPPVAVCWVDE
ncbi:MAG: EthD family reductase [Actinomycetota bacterium]